uniref:Reverse transcriptase domain-containing protein n=1 Tax=Panagrolaimus superbus TaxID=310955 RepID=A0A914YHH1_9BILA
MYSYVSSLVKNKHPPIPVLKSGDQIFIEDQQKAQKFCEYFKSVYNTNTTVSDEQMPYIDGEIILENITFNREMIKEQLKKCSNKNINGPDGIPGIILKKCRNIISLPLTYLFNQMISKGEVPKEFLLSHVTPIPKIPNPKNFNDYRPISGSSDIFKTFERVLKIYILQHLKEINFLPKQQFGFRNGYSTTKQLISYFEFIYLKVSSGETIDVIYFDFVKAFDKIPIQKLISSLKKAGIRGKLLKIITVILSNRKFLVKVNSTFSNLDDATSGVPQGSVLGPIYFIIFIAELSQRLNLHDNIIHLLFADDLKLLYSYSPKNFENSTLQNAITDINDWCKENSMDLSVPKTHHIQFGKPNEAAIYFIDNNQIIKAENVRDLGVFISKNLSFSQHVDRIVSNATKKLFSITKKVITNDRDILIKIFNTYVRPNLEYCSPLFNIPKLKLIKKLESPQKKFTWILYRRIYGFYSKIPSYEERLKLFNMDSLLDRRNVADALIAHDLVLNHQNDNIISLHYNDHGKTRAEGNYNYYGKIKKSFLSYHFSSRMAVKLNNSKIILKDHSTDSIRLKLTTNKKKNLIQ